VTDLRRDLDLDAGYLSRILSRFIADGLVEREPSATDGRRHVVRLTPAGHAAFAEADTLQAEAIDRLVATLDEDQRCQLVSAMGRIRRVLDDDRDAVGGLVLRAPAPGDLGWVVARHGARYAAAHGWVRASRSTVLSRRSNSVTTSSASTGRAPSDQATGTAPRTR
jgi:MarR family